MTTDEFSIESAREAAARDELDVWVSRFLASPGSDNAPLAEQLSRELGWWIGPVRLPLSRLNRLAGPPGDPVLCPLDEDEWDERVDAMESTVEEGEELPPVIVSYRQDQLVLEDGNHRVEGLRQAGSRTAWAVVGFETVGDRDRFHVSEDTRPAVQDAQRFDFRFDPLYRALALPFGVMPQTAYVEVHADELVARFGPWIVRTPTDNVVGTTRTGPFSVPKTAGPAHLSLVDRGMTMATNRDSGLCIRFREPVQGIDPAGVIRHPGLTVTVDQIDELERALLRLPVNGEAHARP